MTTGQTLRFVVRAGQLDDLPACLNLDHGSTSEHVWQMDVEDSPERLALAFRTVRLPRPMTLNYPKNDQEIALNWQQSACQLVAESEGKIYGYLNMRTDIIHQTGWIVNLVVDQAARRKHIGTALFMQAHTWARTHDLTRITIETQTKNYPAIAFCERLGFRFCGFNDQYYLNRDIVLLFSQSLRT